MKIKPLADRVLIEPKPAEEKTASGLFIPDTAKENKVGDEVLYGKYAGTEVTVDGKDYLIMKQNDILAII